MANPQDDTFDEQATMEAAQERAAYPHPRDILKREHDRILKGGTRAMWRWRSGGLSWRR
jgi:hypothetical protein